MKTLELKLKKDVLIVDLPQKVQNFKEATITNNVLFADGKGNRTCLFIIFRDKLDNENLNEYLKKGLKRIVLDYIEGEFEYKCKGSELTEEIASELVEVDYSNFQSDDENYELKKNYVKDTFEFMSFEESFISAVESKGFYWLKHNVRSFSLYDPRSKTGCHDLEEEDTITKQWKEAEEKTFRNPLIFIKKS